MQKNKPEILIQKYLSHQLNEQEFEELKQWIEKDASHREIFVKLLSLHHVNNQLNLLHQFDKEGSWKSLQNRCNQSVSVSAILSCRPFFILIFLLCIKMKHYGFSRKSIWKNLETFP